MDGGIGSCSEKKSFQGFTTRRVRTWSREMPHSVSVDTSHENGHLERAIARERAQKETEERAWKY